LLDFTVSRKSPGTIEQLMEAFYADQEGMYLKSHSALCAAEGLLLEVGALESFILVMAKWRPADPGDDVPRPSPRPTPKTSNEDNCCSQETVMCCALPCIVMACLQ